MIERPITVGDIVRLSFGFADRSGEGDYEIVRVMPERESGSVIIGFEASMAAKGQSAQSDHRFESEGQIAGIRRSGMIQSGRHRQPGERGGSCHQSGG